MRSSTPRRYATLDAAAERLGVSRKTIRRRISDGSLTGYRIGGRLLRVDLDEVDALVRPIPAVARDDVAS